MKYSNFQVTSYVYAYMLKDYDEEDIQRRIDIFKKYIPLSKVYIENHRGLVDVPQETLRKAKALFEKNGIKTSGGITSTGLVKGMRKPSIYDTYCFTDPNHREEYKRIVRELSEVFDEIILDDYFFTACKCKQCIEAKGALSFQDYKLKLMEDFSKEIVTLSKEVNPNMNFIIKYPNWYESYQETGYNPEKQRNIFDMVFTGTESRNPDFSSQHIQQYESYYLIRWMENVAPGRNGGGWIDPFGSEDNLSRYHWQVLLTALAKAKELMLFNFDVMSERSGLASLGAELKDLDEMMGKLGNPVGIAQYEPFNGEGEGQLPTYLGMCGIPMEPTPDFPEDAPVVFCTKSAAKDKDGVKKLMEYVKNGGTAVVTSGYFEECYDILQDATSAKLTNRRITGQTYSIDNMQFDFSNVQTAFGRKDITVRDLDYRTNASWADILLMDREDATPLLTEDYYGDGRFFILNLPDSFASLYDIPGEVIGTLAKHLSAGLPVYLKNSAKMNLFLYDNSTFAIMSYKPHGSTAKVVLRDLNGTKEKPSVHGVRDLKTGQEYTDLLPQKQPMYKVDSCSYVEEPMEYLVEVPAFSGGMRFFEII